MGKNIKQAENGQIVILHTDKGDQRGIVFATIYLVRKHFLQYLMENAKAICLVYKEFVYCFLEF